MDERKFALFGVIGPLAAYVFGGISISMSPWFDWGSDALSDLGHATRSSVAPIFNFGLLLAGFLIMVYAIVALSKHSKYTSICLTAAAFALQMVSTFDEVYASIHYGVSVLLFASLGVALLVHTVEKKSLLALATFIVGSGSWILYGIKVYRAGVAVPETVSWTAVALWLIVSSLRIYFEGRLSSRQESSKQGS